MVVVCLHVHNAVQFRSLASPVLGVCVQEGLSQAVHHCAILPRLGGAHVLGSTGQSFGS